MRIVSHGGKCCGILHIFGFGTNPDGQHPQVDDNGVRQHDDDGLGLYDGTYLSKLDEILDMFNTRNFALPRLIEVTLVSNQRVWYPILEERGFRLAYEFHNGNTGNIVKVFHLYKRPNDGGNYTYDLNGAPVPPAELSVTATEFYANLRNSGRRGPFSTENEAHEAYPRCRRFERREIMSDGSSVWSEEIPL